MPGLRQITGLGLLVALAFAHALAADVATAAPPPFVVPTVEIAARREVPLQTAGWKYQPGDDPGWARADLDDSTWPSLPSTAFTVANLPASGWTGLGWFRLRVRVAPGAVGHPIGLALQHWGASEIYLDGRLLARFGTVGATPAVEQPFNPRGRPIVLTLPDAAEHVLAIRLSCAAVRDPASFPGSWLASTGRSLGFTATLVDADHATATLEREVTRATGVSLGFGALFATFGLLHALLYGFYPRERGHLYFAAFAFAVAAVMGIDWMRQIGHHGLWTETLLTLAMPAAGLVYCASFLAFLYATFLTRPPRHFAVYVAAWVVTLGLYLREPASRAGDLLSVLLLVVFSAETIRVAAIGLRRHEEGARIVVFGVLGSLVTPLSVALQMSGVAMPLYTRNLATPVAFLALILSASISLARRVAVTNKRLEAKLVEVRELSARQLEQERREAELRLQQERERAEHRRRLKELEDARTLQLSMLPQELPVVRSLDIAAYMKTATEVGGDYYDFSMDIDGTLTVVIGDATGHGLKAGTVVTAAKSLFKAYASEPEIPRLFEDSSRVLSEMQFGSLFMALQVLRIKDGTMRIASAGMPPAVIYRAASGVVEQVTAGGPPLGIPLPWRYEEETYRLTPGDAVLIMTDGVPERFNPNGDMFGYDRTSAILPSLTTNSASEIVDQVVQAAEAWAEGRPQDDDVTVVVVKMRSLPEMTDG